jgi:protein-disulfide isomerase
LNSSDVEDGARAQTARATRRSWFGAVLCVLGVATGVTFGSRIEAVAQPAASPDVTVDVGRSPVKGARSAGVAIVEYADFECPHCASFFRETLPALDARYIRTGRVLLAFKHRPLSSLHPHAVLAATGAECAGEQGRFWLMHDALFSDQQNLSRPSLLQRAGRLALDTQSFDACLDGESRRLNEDTAEATALKITGTPTFLIGTLQSGRVHVRHRVEGARPLTAFQAVLDALLAESVIASRP